MIKFEKHKISLLSIIFIAMINEKAYAYGERSSINYISYFGNLLFFMIIFVGIIFLAIYSTKFIAKRTNYLGKGKYLTVLDSINLSANVKIITIKIYKKVYILSVSNSTTTLIDKVNEEDLDLDFDSYLNQNLDSNNQRDFSEYIDYFKEKISRKNKD